MTRAIVVSSSEVRRIASELSNGRHFFRNGDGWKTFCPIRDSNSGRRKPRPTLSLTVRNDQILVFCRRCGSHRLAILRELVRRGLLPNNFRESSMALALVDEVHAATQAVSWNGGTYSSALAGRACPARCPLLTTIFFAGARGARTLKGRIYWLLAVSVTASQIAKTLGYKHPRNVRLRPRVLIGEGLARRLDDGRYARSDVNLESRLPAEACWGRVTNNNARATSRSVTIGGVGHRRLGTGSKPARSLIPRPVKYWNFESFGRRARRCARFASAFF